jgi:hypothetical protein
MAVRPGSHPGRPAVPLTLGCSCRASLCRAARASREERPGGVRPAPAVARSCRRALDGPSIAFVKPCAGMIAPVRSNFKFWGAGELANSSVDFSKSRMASTRRCRAGRWTPQLIATGQINARRRWPWKRRDDPAPDVNCSHGDQGWAPSLSRRQAPCHSPGTGRGGDTAFVESCGDGEQALAKT